MFPLSVLTRTASVSDAATPLDMGQPLLIVGLVVTVDSEKAEAQMGSSFSGKTAVI